MSQSDQNKFNKGILFLSSYFPLFFILICREIVIKCEKVYTYIKLNHISIGEYFKHFSCNLLYNKLDDYMLYVLIILSIFILIAFSHIFNNIFKLSAGYDIEVIDVDNNTQDFIVGYISAYLLPLLGFSLNSPKDIITGTLIMILLGYIYIKNDMIFINPLLSFKYGTYFYTIQYKYFGEDKIRTGILLSSSKEQDLMNEDIKIISTKSKYIIHKEQ